MAALEASRQQRLVGLLEDEDGEEEGDITNTTESLLQLKRGSSMEFPTSGHMSLQNIQTPFSSQSTGRRETMSRTLSQPTIGPGFLSKQASMTERVNKMRTRNRHKKRKRCQHR